MNELNGNGIEELKLNNMSTPHKIAIKWKTEIWQKNKWLIQIEFDNLYN